MHAYYKVPLRNGVGLISRGRRKSRRGNARVLHAMYFVVLLAVVMVDVVGMRIVAVLVLVLVLLIVMVSEGGVVRGSRLGLPLQAAGWLIVGHASATRAQG